MPDNSISGWIELPVNISAQIQTYDIVEKLSQSAPRRIDFPSTRPPTKISLSTSFDNSVRYKEFDYPYIPHECRNIAESLFYLADTFHRLDFLLLKTLDRIDRGDLANIKEPFRQEDGFIVPSNKFILDLLYNGLLNDDINNHIDGQIIRFEIFEISIENPLSSKIKAWIKGNHVAVIGHILTALYIYIAFTGQITAAKTPVNEEQVKAYVSQLHTELKKKDGDTLQRCLAATGDYDGRIDRDIGAQTQNAAAQFMIRHNMRVNAENYMNEPFLEELSRSCVESQLKRPPKY